MESRQKLQKDIPQKSYLLKQKNMKENRENSLLEQQSLSYRNKLIASDLNDKQITSAVRLEDYRSAIYLLHQLESYIYSKNNETCRADKLLFYYQLSICYYNHAVVYQKVNNNEEMSKYFQMSLKNLQYMQGYITSRQQGVSYWIQVAKHQIQFCSILSQNGRHQQAIAFAQKSLQKLIECFRILQAICFQYIMANRLPQTTQNSRDSRNKTQLVNFKKHVLFQAQKILKQLSSLPEPHELISKFKKKYDSLMQKIFFWKTNQENNQKQLRKQLSLQRKQVNSQRNILGVQKNSFFNSILTLQSFTNLQIRSIAYSYNCDPYFLLSSPKLTQMSFYVSMVYFMMATQIRFSQIDLNINKLKIDEKYKKLNRDERMVKCKMIHMKAIQIAGKFLPQKNEFFSHILNRFNMNYKCVMEQINEQSKQQSAKDLQSQINIQNQQEKSILVQYQYGIQSSFKNQVIASSLISQGQTKILVITSPSLKKLKKIQTNKAKRKLSLSKQKQYIYNFQHQRKQRDLLLKRDRQNSLKKRNDHSQHHKGRLIKFNSSVKKDQIKYKQIKSKNLEITERKKSSEVQNYTQQNKQKQKPKCRTTITSPTIKRKHSSCKIRLYNNQDYMQNLSKVEKTLHFQKNNP